VLARRQGELKVNNGQQGEPGELGEGYLSHAETGAEDLSRTPANDASGRSPSPAEKWGSFLSDGNPSLKSLVEH
jgi:hypothetical protein